MTEWPEGAGRSSIRDRPEFVAAFRAEYRGTQDPLDALHWLKDPLAPGRSGAESPVAALRPLQHAVYGPSPTAGAIARLEQAVRAIEVDRAECLRALASARGVEDDDAERADEAPGVPSGARRGRRLAVMAAVGAAVVLAGAARVALEPRSPPRSAAPVQRIIDDPRDFTTTARALDARSSSPPTVRGRMIDRARGVRSGGRSRAIRIHGDTLVASVACTGSGTVRLDVGPSARALFACPLAPGREDGVLLPGTASVLRYRVVVAGNVEWAMSIGLLTAGEAARLPLNVDGRS